MRKPPDYTTEPAPPYQRFTPDPEQGLSAAQVACRQKQGLINHALPTPSKTVGRILFENSFTLFNLIHIVLAIMVASVGAYRNMLFMGVVLANAAIGIYQELRAKRTIDRLAVLTQPKATVLRDAKLQEVTSAEIVLDDVLVLSLGDQILCDGEVVAEGSFEVDESLLTGEADPVRKQRGDTVYSGSFVVSGEARVQVTHVGQENYAARIVAGAKANKKVSSELMDALRRIVRVLGVLIIPIGVLLFLSKINLDAEPVSRAVVGTVAGIIGMIPEGLVLLTSVALAAGVVKLGARRTLVQSLPCIETLARVDVLCLDKTGTITEGKLEVVELAALDAADGTEAQAIAGLMGALPGSNATQEAIKAYFKENPGWQAGQIQAFSSARKWSGATFSRQGTWILGAPEFVLPQAEVPAEIAQYALRGNRVVLLAHSDQGFTEDGLLPAGLKPRALIVLGDRIRKEAPDTLRFFAEQGVTLKVISGDSAETVSSVALHAGLAGAERYIDLSAVPEAADYKALSEQYTVFGRVSPQQKRLLIQGMKANGHTVGMTGDGVNDVLALREADCSIAMANGSDAARSVSNLVLLDENFASLIEAVKEGRRVINNIGRVATMFLVKTVYSLLLSVLYIFLPLPYPLLPIQMTLISALTKGIPSFFLALEPNSTRVTGNFLREVVRDSLPAGIAAVVGMLMVQIIGLFLHWSAAEVNTLCAWLIGVVGMSVLYRVSRPWNPLKIGMFGVLSAALIAAFIWLAPLFQLVAPSWRHSWIYLLLAFLGGALVIGLTKLFDRMKRPARV